MTRRIVLILTALLSFTVPAYAQMSTFQDNQGITGMTFQTAPTMGMYRTTPAGKAPISSSAIWACGRIPRATQVSGWISART